jgi:hypothetical protein
MYERNIVIKQAIEQIQEATSLPQILVTLQTLDKQNKSDYSSTLDRILNTSQKNNLGLIPTTQNLIPESGQTDNLKNDRTFK